MDRVHRDDGHFRGPPVPSRQDQWCRGSDDAERSAAAQDASTFLGDLHRPKFAYLGDNHPFPNAPRAACVATTPTSW